MSGYICAGTAMSIYLSVYLSVCRSVGRSVGRSVCLSVCLSVYLSVCLSVCLSVFLSVCLSACLPVCLPVCPSARLPVCLSVCLSVYLLSTYMLTTHTHSLTHSLTHHRPRLAQVDLTVFWEERCEAAFLCLVITHARAPASVFETLGSIGIPMPKTTTRMYTRTRVRIKRPHRPQQHSSTRLRVYACHRHTHART